MVLGRIFGTFLGGSFPTPNNNIQYELFTSSYVKQIQYYLFYLILLIFSLQFGNILIRLGMHAQFDIDSSGFFRYYLIQTE